LVYANSLTNCYSIWQGATVLNNYAYTISHVNLDSNVVVSAGSGQSYVWLINSYGGLTTNFEASGNVFPSGTPVQTTSGGGYENDFSPLAYIGVNNNFTNTISVTGSVSPMLYSNGPNMLITSTIGAGKLLLDTNYPNYMPTNAQVKVNNASANSAVLPVLLGGVNGTYNQPANSVQIYNYSRSGNDYSTNAAGTNPPTATFTGSPLTGLAPLSVTFTYTGTGTGSDIYAWTFGDGGTSTAQNPSHTYTSAGTYTVSLQVDAQTQNTSNNYITATNLPTATFTGTPTSGAITLSVAFTYTGTGASTWGWTFGDGGTSTSQNPNHSYTAASTYTVSLIVNNEVTNTQNNYITATNPSSAPPNYAAPLWFH
jgi:PKD repeat protein